MVTDPFVAQLAELCRTDPTRAKWVFVPTHAIGATLGERLAREGTNWVNLRFVTPLDVAVRMAAPFLLERGLDPSEEPLGPALLMRLLMAQPSEPGYFRPLAAHPSMADALWATIRELRFAGIRAADLPPGAFASPVKHAELSGLLAAYERHLADAGVADMPAVTGEAPRHGDWCPIQPGDLVCELPDVLWSPLVRRLLDGLPGERIRPVAAAPDDVREPRRREALATPTDHAAPAPVLAAPPLAAAPATRRPTPAGRATQAATLDIFHAGGRDAEIAEVFRRIASAGARLDQVEIVCASADGAVLAWERAQRFDWPVTIGTGVPVTSTRPGRLLIRYCEWVGGGFVSSDLRRLLQSGDCSPSTFGADDSGGTGEEALLSAGQAARLLLKAGTTWGRGTYGPALTRLGHEYAARAADPEASAEDRAWSSRKAAQARTLAAWVADTLAPVPEPANGTVPLGGMAQAALAFLLANASRASAADAMAVVTIEQALTDLAGTLDGLTTDLASALAFVRASVDSAVVGRDRPRPGSLHVSSLATAGYDGRPHVFVTGLVEGLVFPAAVEDAVLLDDERRAISPLLRTSADRIDEAVWIALARFEAIVASARHVCLSYSCRDTRQFRETFPSWLVLRAFRRARGDASLTYHDLAEALGNPASAVPAAPADALSEADWWLAGVARRTAARPRVAAAFPRLAAGIAAVEARASLGFTEYDGCVPDAGAVLDPSRTRRITSATTLEQAAKCPFSFFLRQGLGVRPIEEGDPDADVWLDGRTKGTELHGLFARLMKALRQEGRRPSLRRDLDRLVGWARARLDELRREMPPPSDEVFARESRDLCDDLEAFLVAECEGRHGEDPVGFEVAFGYPVQDGDEPLALAEPLVLEFSRSRGLVLHGRIDRINRLKAGEYEVVDYKTGGFWRDDWAGNFAAGTRLQHAIYGCAAAELLKPVDARARVTRGRYVFPSVKGHGRQKIITAPARDDLVRVLRDLTDVIGGGLFVAAEDDGPCRWCDFAAACHPQAGEGTAGKVAHEANAMLAPYRRLRRHA